MFWMQVILMCIFKANCTCHKERTTYWPAGMIPMGIFRGTGWKSCDVESNMASRWALMTRPFNTSWNIPSPPTETTLGTQTASFSIF